MFDSLHLFSVEGLNLERFINLAAKEDVFFKSINRVSPRKIIISLRTCDSKQMAHIAQQGGWKLYDLGACGTAKRLESVFKHKVRICLVVMMLVIILMVSQCVLNVEIINGGSYAADIRNYLSEAGVVTPMLRQFCDLDRLRELLNWRYPNIPFIECSFRGTALLIRVYEGQAPGNGQHTESRDVVAQRDGIIVSIITSAGTPAVKAGDVVRKGDVLIKGEEKNREGSISEACAAGEVLARIWETTVISVPITETKTQYTGNAETALTVKLPWFDLGRQKITEYTEYDVHLSEQPLGGVFLPFSVQRKTAYEYETERIRMNEADVIETAIQAAKHKLIAENGFHDDFVDKWVEYSMIDNEVVCVSAYGERITDIASQAGIPSSRFP